MPSLLTEITLFLSSFAPLIAIFSLLNTFGRGAPSIVCLAVAGISLVGLAVFMRLARTLTPIDATIGAVRKRDQDTIGYVVTYLLPFVAIGGTAWQLRTAVVVFVIVVGALYVRAHLFYVNPVLALVGFRLFEVDIVGAPSAILLTRQHHLPSGSVLRVRALTNTVLLEVPRGAEQRGKRRGSDEAA